MQCESLSWYRVMIDDRITLAFYRFNSSAAAFGGRRGAKRLNAATLWILSATVNLFMSLLIIIVNAIKSRLLARWDATSSARPVIVCCAFIMNMQSESHHVIVQCYFRCICRVDEQLKSVTNAYTLWGKKTAPLYFCNNFVKMFCSNIIIGTYIFQ